MLCSPLSVRAGVKLPMAAAPLPPPPTHPPRSQAFNRSTTKYWVRTSDVSTVKRIIIENMPVFVFNKVRGRGGGGPEGGQSRCTSGPDKGAPPALWQPVPVHVPLWGADLPLP